MTVVGRYEIVGELGRGGMATVYLARQHDLHRLAALKELGSLRSADPSFARRFLREAQLAGSLSDPNIVTVYDYFESDGIPYIAMEYLEHGSLRAQVGHMSLAQISGVLQSVLAGLTAAERLGIVHRDLKPENLLVTSEGRVKISDFGIAKATNELRATVLTSTGVAVGTPNYMAPEQATAQGVGPATDLYSVGMMAFEFLVGRPPFGDTDNALGVLLRQVNEEIPPVRELDPRIDPRLSDWVGTMVAKAPAERPPSAAAAWDALEDTVIALLGARWQRESRLDLAGAPAGPSVLFADVRTAPLSERPPATTMPPRVAIPEAPVPAPKRKRQVGRTATRLIVAGVAVVALAAALLARSGGSSGPTQAVTRTTPVTHSTATAAPQPAAPAEPEPVSLTNEAASAEKLARRYDNGAVQIGKLSGARVAGSATSRLAAAMRRTAAAYRAAAAAATAGDSAGYEAALSQAAADRRAVTQALADLRADTGSSTGSQSSPSGPQPACSGDSVSDDPSDESC